MLATTHPYAGITVYFPPGYTEEYLNRLKAQFLGIQAVMNSRCFSIDIQVDSNDDPSQVLKPVFAWIETTI